MAELDTSVFLKPDEKLAQLQKDLQAAVAAKDEVKIATIQAQITARQNEISSITGSAAFGFGGFVSPGNAYSATSGPQYAELLAKQTAAQKSLAGKLALLPTGEPGVYRGAYYNASGELDYSDPRLGTTSDPASKGKANYDPNSTNQTFFYDANGNRLSAQEAAKTRSGQQAAAAGWDIGFGAGVTPNGTTLNTIDSNGTSLVTPFTTPINTTPTSTVSDIEKKARMTAQQEFRAALADMGLADLADVVDSMIKNDFTPAQIRIELPKTKEYVARFPGMEALRKAGRAINEATYIANERAYTQTLRAYGLDTDILGNRAALGTYIANEVSPREFEERVDIAATRVKNNPDVVQTFKTFYPEADQAGLITYMLNPKAGLDVIKKQIRTSEIGAAAVKAGFTQSLMSLAESANLIPAVGESNYNQISQEFQRAKQLSNSQRRLAQIENQQYSDLEAIGAVVGDNLTNIMASERRAAREVARFAGSSGLTSASLRSEATI